MRPENKICREMKRQKTTKVDRLTRENERLHQLTATLEASAQQAESATAECVNLQERVVQ
jgi:hypothetical protein